MDCYAVSRIIFIDYSSDLQKIWSDCAYAHADMRCCWFYIPHCWKSHVVAHFTYCVTELIWEANGSNLSLRGVHTCISKKTLGNFCTFKRGGSDPLSDPLYAHMPMLYATLHRETQVLDGPRCEKTFLWDFLPGYGHAQISLLSYRD